MWKPRISRDEWKEYKNVLFHSWERSRLAGPGSCLENQSATEQKNKLQESRVFAQLTEEVSVLFFPNCLPPASNIAFLQQPEKIHSHV